MGDTINYSPLNFTNVENMNEGLKKAHEGIKAFYVRQGIKESGWNSQMDEDSREIIINHKLQQRLDQLGADLDFFSGQPRVVRRGNPDLEYHNEKNQKVEFTGLLSEVIGNLKGGSSAPAAQTSYGPPQEYARAESQTQQGHRVPLATQERVNDLYQRLGVKP